MLKNKPLVYCYFPFNFHYLFAEEISMKPKEAKQVKVW